jgi:MinD superfamily P-loop ATPase
VINRSDAGDAGVRNYGLDEGIEILAEIPDDRRVAEVYSRGDLMADVLPEYGKRFESLLAQLAS